MIEALKKNQLIIKLLSLDNKKKNNKTNIKNKLNKIRKKTMKKMMKIYLKMLTNQILKIRKAQFSNNFLI